MASPVKKAGKKQKSWLFAELQCDADQKVKNSMLFFDYLIFQKCTYISTFNIN